ncbi:MAG: hypothetical protein KatS3mg121_1522 [Gammaproteobacteria bacterium]|nr:MAG: hypothetical protein KatS3mg121_1522 [Gammaproteobacteria bacterium]
MSPIRRQHGVALITALLVVALASTAAAYMVHQDQLSIRRAANVLNAVQAYQYALGAEILAMSLLHEDRKDNAVDGLDEDWAQPLPPFEVDGFLILGRIEDLQGRFNINDLVNDNDTQNAWALDRFRALLVQFDINPNALNAVIDWLDRNIEPSGPYGAEDDYYLGLDTPYRAANGPMQDISELRLVRGFDVPQFDALAAHLVALPRQTALNVNTAGPELWIAIGARPDIAEQVARRRPPAAESRRRRRGRTQAVPVADPRSEPFPTVEKALQEAGLTPGGNTAAGLSVNSDFFLLRAEVLADHTRVVLNSVLERDNQGMMRVVYRTLGDL